MTVIWPSSILFIEYITEYESYSHKGDRKCLLLTGLNSIALAYSVLVLLRNINNLVSKSKVFTLNDLCLMTIDISGFLRNKTE